jgi:serine/threonine-protein kinase
MDSCEGLPMSEPSADRNLLFGILALQMDFISRDALIAAMHAWVLDKSRSLAQILHEQGALRADNRALLEALVQRHLEMHDNDAEQSLAAIGDLLSIPPDLQHIADPDVQACLTTLAHPLPPGVRPLSTRHGSLDDSVPAPATAAPTNARFHKERFRRLREHAKGGLGEVFVALDEELHREVALKEIQDQFADQLDARARFVREAEITGNLEHPGVVPVYGLGAYPDGRPFYAMRFIKGESMQQAIARFHKADREPHRDAGERSLALRDLLGRFVAMCNAVAYAHSRGVIHRDLKPANAMLGEYGETLVVDWGLARLVEQAPEEETTAERLVPAISGSTGSSPTEMGQVVGTAGYMPPEQAEGRLDRVGIGSDVFALGATLYAVLTGQAPYHGDDVREQARQARVVPARQRKRSVPAALESICAKAMAKEVQDRYPTARALAQEVERFLADEPVLAHQEPLAERVRRWGRRHRTLVSSLLVLLLVSVAGLILGLWAVRSEQRKTEQERDLARQHLKRAEEAEQEAKKQLKRAEENLALARKAVDDCYGLASNHRLFRQPNTRAVRRLLLEQTLPYYRAFAAQKPTDESLAREQAENLFRVGFINFELGNKAEALTCLEQTRRILQQQFAAHPNDWRTAAGLARVFSDFGSVRGLMGEDKQAKADYRESIRILDLVLKAQPGVARYQSDLVHAWWNLGRLQTDAREHADALKSYRQALAVAQALVKAHPKEPDHRADLATVRINLGLLCNETGKPKESLQLYHDARKALAALVRDHPGIGQYRMELARVEYNLAVVLADLGRSEEALAAARQALDLRQKLAWAHPEVTRYQADLARSWMQLGISMENRGDRAAALKHYTEALAIRRTLHQAHPEVAAWLIEVAEVTSLLANVQGALGLKKEAEQSFTEALQSYEQLRKTAPKSGPYRAALARLWHNRGNARLGTSNEKRACYQRALALHREVVKDFPDHLPYSIDLVGTYTALSMLETNNGRYREALEQGEQALALCRRLVKDHAGNPLCKAELARTWTVLAHTWFKAKKDSPAISGYEKARDLYRELVEKHAGVDAYKEALARAWYNLAQLHARSDRLTPAITGYQQARDLWLVLVRKNPGNREVRDALAGVLLHLGGMHGDRGELKEARSHFVQAAEHFSVLVADSPKEERYQKGQATCLFNLGLVHLQKRDLMTSLDYFEQARPVYDRLAASNPRSRIYRSRRAATWYKIALILGETDRSSEAEKALHVTRQLYEQLVKDYPGDLSYQIELAGVWNNLGVGQEMDRPDEGAKSYRMAADLIDRLVKEQPNQVEWRRDSASTWVNLAALQNRQEKGKEALQSLSRALAMLDPLLPKAKPGELTRLLRRLHRERAQALASVNRPREAASAWAEVLQLKPAAGDRLFAQISRAHCLARAGDHREAMLGIASVDTTRKLPVGAMYHLARVKALAAAALARDQGQPLPLREKNAEVWAREAVRHLHDAERAGLFAKPARQEQLHKEKDLDFLRSRDDFKRFCAGLRAKQGGTR